MKIKKYYRSIIFVSMSLAANSVMGQISMAENIASTIMQQYKDSLVVKKYINHLMQDNLLGANVTEKDIEKANQRPANWNYEIGVVLTGFDRLWHSTGNPEYLKYTKKIIDKFIDEKGNIRTYTMDEFNIDNVPPGRQLISLYHVYKDERYLKAANTLKYQLDWQPRTKQGGYWHKLKYPYQMWLDGLYMGQPFRSEYLQQIGGNNEEWNDVALQFMLMANGAFDEKTGLMYHAFDESKIQRWANKTNGKSPEFWSRAMGWYMMGLVDVLEIFPNENPNKAKLLDIFENLSKALVNFQDPQAGVWWQVTDKANKEGNYLESSGSSMFVAAMLKGVRLGYLPSTYLAPAKKGYEGILKQFVSKDTEGVYHLNNAVSGAGLGGVPYRDGSYEYYVKEPKRNDDLKAIGPFMQAAIEYELTDIQSIGKNKTVVLDRFFNNETRNNKPFHYIWEDRFDSGFSWLGGIFNDFGAKTTSLSEAPTLANLGNAKVYIIVDPDTKKETPKPDFIEQNHIDEIKKWVAQGGTLLLMANDTANVEIPHFNKLINEFGISLTDKNINLVKNDNFVDGEVIISKPNEVFSVPNKLYIKEVVTLKTDKKAAIIAQKDKDVVIATTKFGNGKVSVIGDPWIYNEYLNGRKLPKDFTNYKAATELVKWLLK